ncbi:MAG TPA: polyphosphate polymerase domain-containing protein [Tenuifilaceae bacterium]|nr:polyphosphate polymerase domain-containing protein [Tenuifilaceae bacterium]HPJ45571.1 polyphosphate polymerase domain-containing protein [Tenuifilaceae bacterium]HPQ33677.1 polyphosphate polymerase domain-containing protein [Tenuifilaceae bacterium]
MEDLLNIFSPISLPQMNEYKFMDRVDTKFPFPSFHIPFILQSISDSYRVLEIEGNRNLPYHTTYLDTPESLLYLQHVRGFSKRYKARYRTYKITNNTFLEVKFRNTQKGTQKWRIANQPVELNSTKSQAFLATHLNNIARLLEPSIETHFSRVTLVGTSSKERVTLDFNLQFSNQRNQWISLPHLAIAEIKREQSSHHSPLEGLLKKMLIRSTGFSKYCVGKTLLGEAPKPNSIKPKLLLLKRIENEYNAYSA